MKFKIGDLITDRDLLVKIVGIQNDYYVIKVISSGDNRKIDLKVATMPIIRADSRGELYDLNKPITHLVYTGKCFCHLCNKMLKYDDVCFRVDDTIYCSEKCATEDKVLGYRTICEDDLDSELAIEKPLFDLTCEQIELLKKEDK